MTRRAELEEGRRKLWEALERKVSERADQLKELDDDLKFNDADHAWRGQKLMAMAQTEYILNDIEKGLEAVEKLIKWEEEKENE